MNEWIDTRTRLPLEGQDVLMTYNNFVMAGEYRQGKFWYLCPGHFMYEEQEGITDWMEFPEPPK